MFLFILSVLVVGMEGSGEGEVYGGGEEQN